MQNNNEERMKDEPKKEKNKNGKLLAAQKEKQRVGVTGVKTIIVAR